MINLANLKNSVIFNVNETKRGLETAKIRNFYTSIRGATIYSKYPESLNPCFAGSTFHTVKMVYFVKVVGMTGTGKTTYIKSQIDKFLKKSKIKCLIVDIGGDFSEYKKSTLNNLKEDFKKTTILRIQGTEDSEEQTKIYDYIFNHLRNIVVIIDEVNSQGGEEGRLNHSLKRLAIRGRKRGIKLIFAGQRASLISKTLLSSSIVHVLKKQGWDNDYKIYRQLNKDVEQKIRESPNQYCTAVLKQGNLLEYIG